MLLHNWYEVSAGHCPVTYQSSVTQLYILDCLPGHCWLISPFGLIISISLCAGQQSTELERVNVKTHILILILSQQPQSLWLLPSPTAPLSPRFFLFFNWWKLKATIKEKQKDLVKLIAFLTLCYHISIQNLVEMFCARRGIMMTHTARSAPNTFQWYSNVPTPTQILSALTTNFLCFSRGIFSVSAQLAALVTIKVCQVKFLSFILRHFVTQSSDVRCEREPSQERLSAQTNLSWVLRQKLCRYRNCWLCHEWT